MSEVGESYPQSFRQLQCYVLICDVVIVLERLMLQVCPLETGCEPEQPSILGIHPRVG